MPQYEIRHAEHHSSWLASSELYTCKLEEISDFRNQMRVRVSGVNSSANTLSIPPTLYWLQRTAPSSMDKDDEQEVFYTTALTPELANGHLHNAHPVTLEGGEYVMFTAEGLGTGLQEFILTVLRHLHADAQPHPP